MTPPAGCATARTIVELFDYAAGQGVSVLGDDGAQSLAQIAGRGRALAAALGELGIGTGDRVAACLANSTDYLALQAATARLGAILVLDNTRFAGREVADIVGRSGCRLLATEAGRLPGFDAYAAMPDLRHVCVRGAGEAADTPARIAPHAFADLAGAAPMAGDASAPDALCNIFTTSGTTAAPKFAAHDQAAVAGHAVDVARVLAMGPDAVSLQLLPFCGVFGFVQAMAGLAGGAEVIMPDPFDAARAVELARTLGATHIFATDDMVYRMLDALGPVPAGERAFPALKAACFAQFNSALAELPARAEAAGLPMLAPFGMSEVFAIFAVRRHEDTAAQRHRAGGRLVNEGARVRARDPETGLILPPGEVGEIEVKGPHMFRRYFGDAEATGRAFTEDGYLRTGDIGYTEADDVFTYLQRAGDTLRLSGFLVSPAEIEAALMAEAGITGAQVVAVGTPDGNRPVAFVLTEPGVTLDEAAVIAALGRALPKFKTPVRVIELDEFPRTHGPNGTKIQRAKLRAMAVAALGAGAA